PGIDRCAAPGANDNLNFRVALRAPAQCRHVTGEGYLNFAGRLVAQERNRHIGEFKPAFVRAASGAPDELLPFLHRFLQGPGDWRDRRRPPTARPTRHSAAAGGVVDVMALKIDAAVNDEPTQDDEEQNRSGERSPIIFRAPWVGPPTVVAARRATLVFKAWVRHIGTRV